MVSRPQQCSRRYSANLSQDFNKEPRCAKKLQGRPSSSRTACSSVVPASSTTIASRVGPLSASSTWAGSRSREIAQINSLPRSGGTRSIAGQSSRPVSRATMIYQGKREVRDRRQVQHREGPGRGQRGKARCCGPEAAPGIAVRGKAATPKPERLPQRSSRPSVPVDPCGPPRCLRYRRQPAAPVRCFRISS